MKKEDSKQTINCEVDSCKHYNDDDTCKLRAIEVKKQSGCDDCECEDETICSSYEQDNEEDD